MRLIWSALWGAFPREIHLISEFLIPSLRAQALAPLAVPGRCQEWKEEGRPRPPGRGAAGGLSSPCPPSPQAPRCPAAFPNSSRSAPGPRVRALPAERRQPRLCLSLPGQKTLGQGPGHWKIIRRVTKGAGAIRSSDRVRFMNNVPRNAFWSLGVLVALCFGLGACACVHCRGGERISTGTTAPYTPGE